MACYSPVPAFRTAEGQVVMVERGNVVASLTLACGRCVGCRVERARQWTVRVMHEASLYDENCFVTLTYDDAHLPSDNSLQYGDFQRFLKRLRKWRPVRFYMCGEYGDERGRPHYHAALFGVGFREDRYVWRDFGSGHVVYRSPRLEGMWQFGASSIGELTVESANYIARYVMKKVYGDLADRHYEDVDRETGVVTFRVPEFTRMSLKPGIGAGWLRKFESDVYPHDRVVFKARECKPPRYYDQLLKRENPELLEELKERRVAQARARWPDNTPERLVVRETVAKARLTSYRRKLK